MVVPFQCAAVAPQCEAAAADDTAFDSPAAPAVPRPDHDRVGGNLIAVRRLCLHDGVILIRIEAAEGDRAGGGTGFLLERLKRIGYFAAVIKDLTSLQPGRRLLILFARTLALRRDRDPVQLKCSAGKSQIRVGGGHLAERETSGGVKIRDRGADVHPAHVRLILAA